VTVLLLSEQSVPAHHSVSMQQIAASENIPTHDIISTSNLSNSWLVRIIIIIFIVIVFWLILSLTPTIFKYNIPFYQIE